MDRSIFDDVDMLNNRVTLSRYLLKEEKSSRGFDLEFSTLLVQMSLAGKILSHEIRRAALVGGLGIFGDRNITGDVQKKLDILSNKVILDVMADQDLVAGVVSEEMDKLRKITCGEKSRYILCVDPLDGSSNTDVNGSVGTIFGFYRREKTGRCPNLENELLGSAKLVMAGYILYGPSTVFVYGFGNGVKGFTLDLDWGEFLLSREDIRCPSRGYYYSVNLKHYHEWAPNTRNFINHLIESDSATGRPYSLRYSGALVADLHRTLLEGGIYFYPRDSKNKNGKLRLLYECVPLAFIIEKGGGRASDGAKPILNIKPKSLHQKTPLVIGSPEEVELFEKFHRE